MLFKNLSLALLGMIAVATAMPTQSQPQPQSQSPSQPNGIVLDVLGLVNADIQL